MAELPGRTESRSPRRRFRARWAVVLAVLAIAAGMLVWSRPTISLPFSDGSTATISAVTTGEKVTWRPPLTISRLWYRITQGSWILDETTYRSDPATAVWTNRDLSLNSQQPVLTDRHGWHWASSGSADVPKERSVAMFPLVDNEGPLWLEVFDRDQALLAKAQLWRPTGPAVPPRQDVLDSLPCRPADGPLSVVVRSLQVRDAGQVPSQAQGRLRFESQWNGRPFTAGRAVLKIEDSLHRESRQTVLPGGLFKTKSSPFGTVWRMKLELTRGYDLSLDPDEMVTFEPKLTKSGSVETWDGEVQGVSWRVIVANSPDFHVPCRFKPSWWTYMSSRQSLRIREADPVILVNFQSERAVDIRIDPLDREGNRLRTRPVDLDRDYPEFRIVRCPGFDPGEGHTLRIGFNVAREVEFVLRPEVIMGEFDP